MTDKPASKRTRRVKRELASATSPAKAPAKTPAKAKAKAPAKAKKPRAPKVPAPLVSPAHALPEARPAGTVRVLAIDPAMSNLGLVVADVDVVSGEIVGTPELRLTSTAPGKDKKTVRKSSDDLRRCRELYTAMAPLVDRVDLVCSEMPIGSQNSSAMKGVGVCTMLLATISKPLIELTPEEVKLAAVGKKTATKAEMISWAYHRHPEADWLRANGKPEGALVNANEHIADAVAVIRAGTLTDQFKLLALGFAQRAAG